MFGVNVGVTVSYIMKELRTGNSLVPIFGTYQLGKQPVAFLELEYDIY